MGKAVVAVIAQMASHSMVLVGWTVHHTPSWWSIRPERRSVNHKAGVKRHVGSCLGAGRVCQKYSGIGVVGMCERGSDIVFAEAGRGGSGLCAGGVSRKGCGIGIDHAGPGGRRKQMFILQDVHCCKLSY